MDTSSEDIFKSSASYYTEFRKPYPELLFRRIRDQFHLDGMGTLLDVGCGTGQLALPLSRDFERVVGVDLSGEMVAAAARNATGQGISNTEFHTMPGEDISSLADVAEFSLVTYGSALHWMDILKTLTASHSLLKDRGGIAILGMRSIWGGEADWEQAVIRVIQKWVGEDRRAGSGTFNDPRISYVQALVETGFSVFEENMVEAEYTVDVPFIFGHLYTTSYCNRDLLGDDIDEFEHELTHELLEIAPEGKFRWSPGATYIFARKSA